MSFPVHPSYTRSHNYSHPHHHPHHHLPNHSPLRGKTPSLPTIRYSPSVVRNHDTERITTTPRPLQVAKLKKSPSMPFRMGGGMREKEKERYKDREKKISSSRSFFGMGFPPSPKARSSSAGVLNEKKDIERNGTVIRSSAPAGGAGMAWLQRPQSKDAARDRVTKGHGWAVFPLADARDLFDARAGERTTAWSSSNTSSADVRPHSDEPLGNDRAKKETFLRRAASTGAGYGSFVKQKLDFRRSEATQQLTREHAEPKSPEKGWARNALEYSKGLFHSTSVSTEIKRRDSNTGGDRCFSFSSAKSVLAVYAPSRTSSGANEASSATEIDGPGNPLGEGLPRGAAFKAEWQVDGQDGSKPLVRRSSGVPKNSVLEIFGGNIGGKVHTEERKSGQWRPPVLCLETVVVAQRDKIPVASPDSEGRGRRVWVSVEFEGKVHFNGDKPLGSGAGLDVGVLMDLSPYTSQTSFASMKYQAKRIVEAMESARDRVAVMTFPRFPSPKVVNVLHASGSVSKKQLLKDIASMTRSDASFIPSHRNINAALHAALEHLESMHTDSTRRLNAQRHKHIFLLTSQLDDGDIELLPEVFHGQVHIHVLGIGSLFWPTSEMGGTGWCVPMSSFGPRPTDQQGNNATGKRENRMRAGIVKVEDIIKSLRMAVDLGELRDVNVHLEPGEYCSIVDVMGDTIYPRLLPGEKRTLMVQVEVGNIPLATDTSGFELDGGDDDHDSGNGNGGMDRLYSLLEATLGDLKSRLLTVNARYRHSHYPEDVSMFTGKVTEVTRFVEDSVWRYSSDMGKGNVDPDRSPIPTVTREEYVHKVHLQKVASIHSSPIRALRAVEELSATAPKGEVSLDFNELWRELRYRAKMEEKFNQTIFDDTERTPRAPRRVSNATTASSSSSAAREYWAGGRLIEQPMTPTPIIRRYPQNSDDSPLDVTQEPGDEAAQIWRDMKLRRQGGDGSNDAMRRGGTADANGTGMSLVTLRNVKETDFPPWAV